MDFQVSFFSLLPDLCSDAAAAAWSVWIQYGGFRHRKQVCQHWRSQGARRSCRGKVRKRLLSKGMHDDILQVHQSRHRRLHGFFLEATMRASLWRRVDVRSQAFFVVLQANIEWHACTISQHAFEGMSTFKNGWAAILAILMVFFVLCRYHYIPKADEASLAGVAREAIQSFGLK